MKNKNIKLNRVNSANQNRMVDAFSAIAKQLHSNKDGDFSHAEGGQLLAQTAQFIPGIGPIAGGLITAGISMREEIKQEAAKTHMMEAAQQNSIPTNQNIYGFANGGHINSGFKQYNTGSHQSGRDQKVDIFGNPNSQGQNAIQNKENSFTTPESTFVMSDTLMNPLTGNTFNLDAALINKKYKKADTSEDERNALNLEMNRLSKVNDLIKNVKESVEMACGGMIKKYPDGGPIDPKIPIPLIQNDTTRVEPIPTMLGINQQTQIPGIPLQPFQPGYIATQGITSAPGYNPMDSGSSHSKSKERFLEKSFGGILDTILNPRYNTQKANNFQAGDYFNYGKIDASGQFIDTLNTDGRVMEPIRAFDINNFAKGGYIDPEVPKTNSIFDLGLLNDTNVDLVDSVPVSDNFGFYSNPSNTNFTNQQGVVPTIPSLNLPTSLDSGSTFSQSTVVDTPNPNKILNNIGNRVEARDRMESGVNSTSLGNMNTVAVALKAAALGRSAYDATRPFERESLIAPDYTKSDKQMYGRNYDYTQARQAAEGAANQMSTVNRSSTGSFSQYQNRQGQNFGNLADNLSNIYQQEANQNIGLNLQRGQYEANKSVDFANRQYQNRMDNQMNKANRDFATDKFFSDLSLVGNSFNEYQYHKDMVTNQKEVANAKINEGLALIGSNYTNFGFTEDFIKNLKSGNASIDDKIKFISTTEKIKSTQTIK